MVIKKETLVFLKDIAKNNNREWFEQNKPRYLAAKENMENFAGEIKNRLEETDMIEKVKSYRIYRDIRFSKDKTCLLYTSPSPRDLSTSRMPSSA